MLPTNSQVLVAPPGARYARLVEQSCSCSLLLQWKRQNMQGGVIGGRGCTGRAADGPRAVSVNMSSWIQVNTGHAWCNNSSRP